MKVNRVKKYINKLARVCVRHLKLYLVDLKINRFKTPYNNTRIEGQLECFWSSLNLGLFNVF